MKRVVVVPLAVGTLIAALGLADPALARTTPDRLVCSPSQNGGHLVGGVCVLPEGSQGQPYEGFILTSQGSGGTFRIASGGPPPGLTMPPVYGAAGTVVAGTPTQQGTFTFAVSGIDQHGQPLGQTYRITVGPPPPLQDNVTGGCPSGTVGVPYEQNFFAQGGVKPWIWSRASGSFPPGLALHTVNGPDDRDSVLSGTPTRAGRFTFTMEVTDSHGATATSPSCTVTIGA
jgi:hypothetical protein